MSRLLNAIDAAHKLGYRSRDGLYKATKRHGIPHMRIGDCIRYDETELDRYIEVLKQRRKLRRSR